jgi:hypothetical protein
VPQAVKEERRTIRARVTDALVDSGVHRDDAVGWCRLWEVEAARQRFGPDIDYFWDATKGWIDAHRGTTKPLP